MKTIKNILTIIPARGGSKGIPRKNIKLLGQIPLLAYTILAAKSSKYVNRLILSTEDDEIATIGREWGVQVPFKRPVELSTDEARAIDVIKHALIEMERIDEKKYEIIIFLEPPSPFRTPEDIDNCVNLFLDNDPSSVVSVQKANQYHPILMKKIEKGILKPIWKNEPECVPRQLYDPAAYMRNGAVYILRRENIVKNKVYGNRIIPYIMPDERSICIDSTLEWYTAEAMLSINKD